MIDIYRKNNCRSYAGKSALTIWLISAVFLFSEYALSQDRASPIDALGDVCDVPDQIELFNVFLNQRFGGGISGTDHDVLISEFGFSLLGEIEGVYRVYSPTELVRIATISKFCTAPDDVEYNIFIGTVIGLQGQPIDSGAYIIYDKEIVVSGMRDFSFFSISASADEYVEVLSAISIGKLNRSEIANDMARMGCSYQENTTSTDTATTEYFCPINMETTFRARLALWDFSKRITFTYDSENLVNSVRIR